MADDEHDPGDQQRPQGDDGARPRRRRLSARTSAISAACSAPPRGCRSEFGKTRAFDAPITECGIVATAVGMAAYGLKPVIEIQFADYIYPGYDQIVSEVAKMRYRTAGEWTMPMVIRSPYGGGIFGGQTHSQSPGKPVHPYRRPEDRHPVDALRRQGPADRRDRGPRPGDLLRAQAHLQRPVRRPPRPAGDALGQASGERGARRPLHRAARQGGGRPRGRGADRPRLRHDGPCRAGRGRGATASTPRSSTCARWSRSTSRRSSNRSRRPAAAWSSRKRRAPSGFGAELAALVQERCFYHLEAPVERVTGWDTPYPHAYEWAYFPGPKRIKTALEKVMAD